MSLVINTNTSASVASMNLSTNSSMLQKSLAGLEAAHGVLQARISRELRLKRTPQLVFEYDPSIVEGVRMSALIERLAPPDDDPADD